MERPLTEQQPKLTEDQALELAQNMAAWFPDYLYGVIDVPAGFLPPHTVGRLKRQFGDGDAGEQLARIRDNLMAFEEADQSNLALYFCGYSDSALSVLADEERGIADSVLALDVLFPPLVEIPPRRTIQVVQSRPQSGTPISLDGAYTDLPTYGMPEINIPEWVVEGLCGQTDPEAFFPEKGGSTRDAKKICTECDVRDQCLEYALENDERFGVWGGLSERERRKLKPSRRQRSA